MIKETVICPLCGEGLIRKQGKYEVYYTHGKNNPCKFSLGQNLKLKDKEETFRISESDLKQLLSRGVCHIENCKDNHGTYSARVKLVKGELEITKNYHTYSTGFN